VPNSLDINGTSVLITGSNMSGKTTFVRALGVNAILAQTLHTVCADVWRGPMLRVRTSIERADSVMEGKSYYLAEVEAVRALVRSVDSGRQHLFLLDEIFRGTNTGERVAAAYAVLEYLNRVSDIAVVATHDVELLDLLGGAYLPMHFREQITDGALTFDYKIQAGPSSTRNAIALLRVMQFPEDIVNNAIATIGWENRRGR
jgi:DNA mismatch repair ATPase MutS